MQKPKSMPKNQAENGDRRPGTPRKPSRGRGLIRYDALVDATEELLQVEDPDEVGLYRIAEQAGVPPASVYHFFPTKEAAFTALAMRIMDQLLVVHNQPIQAREVQTWQDLFRFDSRRGADFYNDHPAGLKIFYGGYGGVDARRIDEAGTKKLAYASYARLNKIFHMPYIRDPQFKFACRMNILDSFWSASVQRHGRITDQYHDEAVAASIAYARTYLPDRIEPREEFRELIESDGFVSIPFADFAIQEEAAESPGD